MRIVTLIENTASREDLSREHGLSLYIETGDLRILFDAGQTDAFAANAEKLGVDLTKVDMAILSHGHYDHGGGLRKFLQINKTAQVHVSRYAFADHYNAEGEYIGLDPALLDSGRIRLVDGSVTLAPGVRLYAGEIPLQHPIDPAGLTVLREGTPCPETFAHEQYLQIREGEKYVCFSGCSHRGILNVAAFFRPQVLVGGFHFMKLTPQEDAERLTAAARQLLEYPTEYYTGHCTGEAAYTFMKSIMGQRLNAISTGSVIEL